MKLNKLQNNYIIDIMFTERDYMSKEEIEKKGYTYIEEKRKLRSDWDKSDFMSTIEGIIVYKDGYYGVLDKNTGEELSPCVHLSGTDAINDLYMLNLQSTNVGDRKLISVQKVLKDNLDNSYNPYIGSVVRLMFDIFGLPNGVYYISDWSGCKINEENFIKTALRLYESVAEIMKNGGKSLLIYDYGATEEIIEYGRSLERKINGDFIFRIKHMYDTLTPEEKEDLEKRSDYYNEKKDNYVKLLPALSYYVKLRKINFNPMNIERTGYYHEKEPLIDIGENETIYYEDLHEHDKSIIFNKEEFRKGVSLEPPKEK